jgi:NAD(P)-dependent dehydrogenase (short-subunit alcohol dehydrogenase family)
MNVSHLAKDFSTDLREQGIRVNAISPGFIETPMTEGPPQAQRGKIIAEDIPVKRFATAKEMAEGAAFLATPRSSYIIGDDLVMNGRLSPIFPAKF